MSLKVIVFLLIARVNAHLVGDKAYLTELKRLCEHAYVCFHDKVLICGKSVNEMKTFLDLCDLYEYSCEYNMAYLLKKSTVIGHSETIKNEEECKIAELCVHDKVPMCGIDSCGEMRTFIDTCDMHEFNCDSKKDFKQRPIHECWVTCKRGRSFKKPEFRADCNMNIRPNTHH